MKERLLFNDVAIQVRVDKTPSFDKKRAAVAVGVALVEVLAGMPVMASVASEAKEQITSKTNDYQTKKSLTAPVLVATSATEKDKQVLFEAMPEVVTKEYGKSGVGRPLYVTCIKPVEVKSTILAVFEIHGYEDAYPKDGQILVNIGNKLIEYFADHPKQLDNTALYVVPSANPDGLIDGNTNNGEGRCQVSLGIDINRDFDANFRHNTKVRNKTLMKPFSSPEARSLAELTKEVNPNIVLDFHGWLNKAYGDRVLCNFFIKELGFNSYKIDKNGKKIDTRYGGGIRGAAGYYTNWVETKLSTPTEKKRVALVEYKNPNTNPQDTIDAFIKLIESLKIKG